MRPRSPRYPVDRYLIDSSRNFEMVNIIDDKLWHSEPTLRPEDEIILRRLHDMLQSTADDLKVLSGELSKFHEPGIQIRTQRMPLDEEFNEKVHIEEIVNAKFHGYKIIDKSHLSTPKTKDKLKTAVSKLVNLAPDVPLVTSKACMTQPVEPTQKKARIKKFVITHPNVISIEGKIEDIKSKKVITDKVKSKPKVNYNEFTYECVEPKPKNVPQNKFVIQDMPKIDIRSELRAQKVLELDIVPDSRESKDGTSSNNIAVISVEHNLTSSLEPRTTNATRINNNTMNNPQTSHMSPTVRKISKLSTYESSGSSNNVSSDTLHNVRTQKHIKSIIRSSPRPTVRSDRAKSDRVKKNINKKETEKLHLKSDEWKRKLNAVYGKPSTSKNNRTAYKSQTNKFPSNKSNVAFDTTDKHHRNILNNAEYIPYSQLTLGGARVSDVEREISNIPNKNDIPLSPILDKLLSSNENSPRKPKRKERPSIFTTSDENLLEEVLKIERKVSKTIAKNVNIVEGQGKVQDLTENKDSDDKDTYADDFEEYHSENTEPSQIKPVSIKSRSVPKMRQPSDDEENTSDSNRDDVELATSTKLKSKELNKTFTKQATSSLSFKNSVDIFEFVHSVDTQESATQSNTTNRISLKETQTSPRNDKQSIHPIHNDLWPSIDPRGEVEKMFKLEKDLIKKLIVEQYGDLLEKNLTKPSTSRDFKEEFSLRNTTASQKNTQTSPAHVKSVMTSPTRTKTRTTSPFLSVKVDNQTSPCEVPTSPMIIVTNHRELTVDIDKDEESISINLSSPRFSLRLPQTSREVLSNLQERNGTPAKVDKNIMTIVSTSKNTRKIKHPISSSSVDGDNSSDISSLGEVKLNLKTKQKKRALTTSESSTTSVLSKYSSDFDFNSASILPLRSEGEVSFGQIKRNVNTKSNKSEGEASIGQSK